MGKGCANCELFTIPVSCDYHTCLGPAYYTGKNSDMWYGFWTPKKLPVSNEAVSPTLQGGQHSPLEEETQMGTFTSSYGSEYTVVARNLGSAVVAVRNEPITVNCGGKGLRVRIQADNINCVKLPKGFVSKSGTHASQDVAVSDLPKVLGAAFDAIA